MCSYGLHKNMERRNVTITEEQDQWVRDNHINLSSLVRECIDNHRGEDETEEG